MGKQKIRVENLASVVTSEYGTLVSSGRPPPGTTRPFTILFIKPYQPTPGQACGPPLGILTLAAGLRHYFGDAVRVHFWDMQLYQVEPDTLAERLDEYDPDVVAVSALNLEAAASYRLAAITKAWKPDVLTVIGGPFALHQSEVIFQESVFDWVFEGAADRTFPQALERHFSGRDPGEDLPGFNYRKNDSGVHIDHRQDLIKDLDSIPLPAWDLLDFERYRRRDRKRMITNVDERRYAFLFTSRGCPYLCNYCHDLFTKRFVYRSEEHVLQEMEILYERHGVREFHIVDDIFNLHKPRVQSLMRRIAERWPSGIYIAFPNGVRGDIFDEPTIEAMVAAGTYHVCIAIETVQPRLQTLIEKHLDVDKASWAIEQFARRGVVVQSFFMLGFPTETDEEIEQTIRFAIHSPITHAYFFAVVPQPQTPIHELAMEEAPVATRGRTFDERHMVYGSPEPWYARAYGYDLEKVISRAYLRFYLYPPRLWRIVRLYSAEVLWRAGGLALLRVARSIWNGIRARLRRPRINDPSDSTV